MRILDTSVRILQGEFDLPQLNAWFQELRDPVARIDGVWETDLNEGKNRIHYRVISGDAAEEPRDVVRRHNVPPGAVIIEIDAQMSTLGGR